MDEPPPSVISPRIRALTDKTDSFVSCRFDSVVCKEEIVEIKHRVTNLNVFVSRELKQTKSHGETIQKHRGLLNWNYKSKIVLS